MELRRLPLDCILPILERLEIQSLARLHATLDRQIQRRLTSPNAIAQWVWDNSTSSSEELRYFSQSARNVRSLDATSRASLSLDELSRFVTLNPLKLTLGSNLYGVALSKLLKRYFRDPENPLVARLKEFFPASTLLPDLARLTPRLESLDILCDSFHNFVVNFSDTRLYKENYNIRLPPTLTHIGLAMVSTYYDCTLHRNDPSRHPAVALFGALPRYLRSMNLQVPLRLLEFSSFTQLESLVLRYYAEPYSQPGETPAVTLPASLTCLSVNTAFPDGISVSSLTSLALTNIRKRDQRDADGSPSIPAPSNSETIELTPNLPCTLRHLEIRYHLSSDLALFSRPPSWISSLSLHLNSPQKFDLLAVCLRSCLKLTELQVSISMQHHILEFVGDEHERTTAGVDLHAPMSINTSIIPRSVTNLAILWTASAIMVERQISDSSICALPHGLQSLRLSSFPAIRHHLLLDTSPQCRLIIENPINITDEEDDFWRKAPQFAPHWGTTLDFDAWSNAVETWLHENKVTLTFLNRPNVPLYPLDAKTLKCHSAASQDPSRPRLGLSSYLSLHVLVRDCSSTLTHVDIDLQETGYLFELATFPNLCHAALGRTPLKPPNNHSQHIEHISSSYLLILMEDCLPKATHVDTPNWTFRQSTATSWKNTNMTKLCATFGALFDSSIEKFLAESFSHTTRSHMSIEIMYHASGALLTSTSGVENRTEVSWETIQFDTRSALELLLKRPLPSATGFGTKMRFGATSASASPTTPTVTAPPDLFGKGVNALRQSPFKGGSPICLVSKCATSISIEPGCFWTLRPTPTTESSKMNCGNSLQLLPSTLVRLELINIDAYDTIWKYLPKTLRYLHLHMVPGVGKTRVIPPHLETLLLNYKEAYGQPLPFLMSCLPTSIVTVGLLWSNIHFELDDMVPSLKAENMNDGVEEQPLDVSNGELGKHETKETESKILKLPLLRTLYLCQTTLGQLLNLVKSVCLDDLERFVFQEHPSVPRENANDELDSSLRATSIMVPEIRSFEVEPVKGRLLCEIRSAPMDLTVVPKTERFPSAASVSFGSAPTTFSTSSASLFGKSKTLKPVRASGASGATSKSSTSSSRSGGFSFGSNTAVTPSTSNGSGNAASSVFSTTAPRSSGGFGFVAETSVASPAPCNTAPRGLFE